MHTYRTSDAIASDLDWPDDEADSSSSCSTDPTEARRNAVTHRKVDASSSDTSDSSSESSDVCCVFCLISVFASFFNDVICGCV